MDIYYPSPCGRGSGGVGGDENAYIRGQFFLWSNRFSLYMAGLPFFRGLSFQVIRVEETDALEPQGRNYKLL